MEKAHIIKELNACGDVFEGVLGLYYRLFYFMEDEGFLDPLNEIHLGALHYVYLPVIEEKLKVWSSAWSHHWMRITRSSPIRICGSLGNYKTHEVLN